MASKIDQLTLSQEERAAVQVQNMENAVSIGATKNLVDAFQRFRQSTSNADLEGTALSGGATSSHSVEMEEKTNPATTKNKEWRSAKKRAQWNTDFRRIEKCLEVLEGLYEDKMVVQFNKARRTELNKKIAQSIKKVKVLFTSMKADVDKINRWLFSKEKDEFGDNLYCGEGKAFEDLDEWGVAERIVIKLTQRLQEAQKKLNKIMVKDKNMQKYIRDVQPAHGAATTGAQKMEKIFANFEMNQLKQEEEEVKEIVNAVRTIVDMVQQMATMITEQGTIVDRIDYNLEVASARTLKGEDFFKKAERKNEQAGSMAVKCIAVLCVSNAILGIIIMWKLSEQ